MHARSLTAVVSLLILAGLPALAATSGTPAERCGVREDDVVTPHRALAWKDFRGGEPPRGQATARIATSIELGRFEVVVEAGIGGEWVARPARVCAVALMDKLRSGYTAWGKNDAALAHEQVHFDITEHFARRLEAAVAALTVRSTDRTEAEEALRRQAERLRAENHREWQAMQDLYDGETRNGRKRLAQRRWERRVAQLLAAPPAPQPAVTP